LKLFEHRLSLSGGRFLSVSVFSTTFSLPFLFSLARKLHEKLIKLSPQTVEVPGCDPYREYLFNYLRDQPIWHTLRFWNAALFYALQKDKVPKANAESSVKCSSSSQLKTLDEGKDALTKKEPLKNTSRSISESSLSSSSSTDNTKSSESSKYKAGSRKVSRSRSSLNVGGIDNTLDEQKLHENMAFSHLG
jgi:hypothetical protein